jgi:hypothetical protein
VEYITPEDYKQAPIIPGGKQELLLTGKGVLKLLIIAYKEDSLPKGELGIDELCKMLALRKYGKGAKAIKRDIDKMDMPEAMNWISRIWEKHVTGNDMIELFNRIQ